MRLTHTPRPSYRLIILCIIDIIVVFGILWNESQIQYDLLILVLYVFIVIDCLSFGYIHISSRMEGGIINEYNNLFRLPIMLFGKDAFTNLITVMNLYVSLCVIHIGICIIYVIKSMSTMKNKLQLCNLIIAKVKIMQN